MYILIGVVVVLVLWTLSGALSSNVEQAEYTVLKKGNGYEVREYPAHLVAQTKVEGSHDEALSKGFRIVAGYIFGGNTKKEKIAMTAPVVAERQSSENIAMTAPVISRREGTSRIVSFGMPKGYTLETLPTPQDSRVELVEIPAKKMAVLRFSWFRTPSRVTGLEKKLLALLERDKVSVVGSPAYAGYNAPWTPPWMTRNEILVEVQ